MMSLNTGCDALDSPGRQQFGRSVGCWVADGGVTQSSRRRYVVVNSAVEARRAAAAAAAAVNKSAKLLVLCSRLPHLLTAATPLVYKCETCLTGAQASANDIRR